MTQLSNERKHLTVKQLPDSEKPYEKCQKYGPEFLSDAELLAVVFRTGTRGKTSVELAQLILAQGNQNLLNLYDFDLRRLMQIPGIGEVKAVQLKCIAEISKRIAKTTRKKRMAFESPSSIAEYYMESMRHETQERFLVCMFDGGCQFLGDFLLTIGSVNQSLVSPREVFIRVLNAKAVMIILLHNHPSGAVTPSQADVQVTERIAECGKLLQIKLADHIIIGDNQYYSFREKGLLDS